MAKTDLKVTIDAEAAKLEREIQRTQRSMDRLARDIQRTELQAAKLDAQLEQQTARALERVGRGMLVFGAATLAGLGLATKAAMDWESAWAGVLKTVEGSPEQLAEVEAGLRDLATTLPATHTEIAAVAEAAGQLGIATPDIVGFTRVMIDLGETTNLSATEAATALARFMNIMGTASDDVDRLGSTIVDLGNNAETTEAEIVEMATRIAGAGATVGMAETDVLALATAMSSVGIRAEAGGTAISRVMSDIASAVASGGDAVTDFAEVAGMSASEFAAAFERDPARAIQSFIEGLGRINDAGGNVFGTLDNLGLGGIRVRDVLLRLSSAGDILNENLDRSAQAWEDNSALVEEAERRYDTAEAKIQIAKNALVDLGIDVGSVLLPALSTLAEGVADVVGWFTDLPGPVKTILTIFAGLVGTLSLLGGGFLLLAPRLAAARAELQLMAVAMPRLAASMKLFTLSIPVVGVLLAAASGIAAIAAASKDAGPAVSDATKALLDLGDGLEAQLVDDAVAAAAEMQRLSDVLKGLSPSVDRDLFRELSGQLRSATGDVDAFASSFDKALAELVSTAGPEQAEQAFADLAAEFENAGISTEQLRDMMPQFAEALLQVENQTRATEESVDPLEQGLADLATQFGLTGDDAAKAAQEMLDAWADASTEFIDILGAYNEVLAAKEEKERETAQETADATEDASDSWEDYVKDVKVSIDEYLKELERQVKAQQNWQKNMLTLAGRVSAGTLDELAKLGPEGAPLVAELVDASDEELARFEELMGARAEAGGQNFAERLAEAEPVLKQIARDEGQEVANSIAAGMAANGSTVFEEAKRQGVNVDRGVGTNRTRQVPINVPLPTGLRRVDGVLNNLARPRFATVHVGYAVSGGLPVGLQRGHSGGRVTKEGIRRFHGGGTVQRFHSGSSQLANDEVPAILQTGEVVLSRAQVAMMQRARYLELLARGMVRLGDVTDDEWEQLKALGWQGRAGDRMEALYPPLEGVRREFIKLGEVTNAEWQRLMRLGWQGKAGDLMEALYPPLSSLAVEADRAAKLLRDANLSRIGASGKRRTWDFFRSGGKSFAHIFGTGETLALGQMGEMQAGDFLRAMGKIPRAHQGGQVIGTDEGLAILQRGEAVFSRQAVALARMMPSMPVTSRPRGGDGSSVLRVEGSGPGFDWIINGVRTGQLRLSVNGAAVRAG